MAFDERQSQDIDLSVKSAISAVGPKIEEVRAPSVQNQQTLKEQHVQKKEAYLIPQAAAQLGGGVVTVAKDIGGAILSLGSKSDSHGENLPHDVSSQSTPTGQTQIVQSSGGGAQSIGNSRAYGPTEERSPDRYDPEIDSRIALSERQKEMGFEPQDYGQQAHQPSNQIQSSEPIQRTGERSLEDKFDKMPESKESVHVTQDSVQGSGRQSHQRADQAQRHEQFGPRRILSSERNLPKDDRFNKETEAPSKDDVQITNDTSLQNPGKKK